MFQLDSLTLENPNSFSEEQEVTGEIVSTMTGSRRRAVRGKKRAWRLGWTRLTESEFASLKTKYDLNTTLLFENSSLSPTISATVHMDLTIKTYQAGTGNYVSEVEIILTEA